MPSDAPNFPTRCLRQAMLPFDPRAPLDTPPSLALHTGWRCLHAFEESIQARDVPGAPLCWSNLAHDVPIHAWDALACSLFFSGSQSAVLSYASVPRLCFYMLPSPGCAPLASLCTGSVLRASVHVHSAPRPSCPFERASRHAERYRLSTQRALVPLHARIRCTFTQGCTR